jgi:hypothetical protein
LGLVVVVREDTPAEQAAAVLAVAMLKQLLPSVQEMRFLTLLALKELEVNMVKVQRPAL